MQLIKNITLVTAVYPPEPQATARMSYDLASFLAAKGYYVSVLCPQPSRLLNIDHSQCMHAASPLIIYESKIKVVRLPSFASSLSRLIPRMWESISFGFEVIKYLNAEKDIPDVLYVNSWPLFAQALIVLFARKFNIPIVLQIMDIYPESLIKKLPAILGNIIHKPLKLLDAWITGTVTAVIVISENMRKTYTVSRRIPVERVITIPTWQDETIFNNIPDRSECCRRYGIPTHPFTFLFLGNFGPVAGVDFLIRAFGAVDIPNAQLLLVGDGASKSDCVALVRRLNLSRVYFISDPEYVNVPLLQGMAHVCMLPMKRGAGLSSIPSKLPSYLFSAKPVIATVDHDSDTARIVHKAECGWVGDAEDLGWLANKMKEVSQMSMEQLETIGLRGKKYGLKYFSKSSGVPRLADTIIQASLMPSI